jgi:hypothetical protein
MEENRSPAVEPQRIPCKVCQHEIPLSEALMSEAADYVAYFCSLDCYASWRAQAAASYASSDRRPESTPTAR